MPTFLVVVFLCVVIMALSLSGSLNFLLSPLEKVASAIQGTTFGIFQKLPFVSENTKVKQLEEKGFLKLFPAGNTLLVRLNFDNFLLTDLLSEMELKKKMRHYQISFRHLFPRVRSFWKLR